MKFTIITGPGRTGTSVLTKFFITSKKFNIDSSDYIPKMSAGYESNNSALANFCYNSGKIFDSAISQGDNFANKVVSNYNLIKSPTFFYIPDSYQHWNRMAKVHNGIQVILTKRDNPENIIKSAERINLRDSDWKYLEDVDKINEMWNENIEVLENLQIPYTTMDFPTFVGDANYLNERLKMLDFHQNNFTIEEVINLSNKIFDLRKINII